MSIYISGVEMPTKGNETIIRILPDGTVLDQYGHHLGLIALFVPEHGRLGDLDELKERLKKPVTMDANRAERLWEGWHECTIGVEQAIDALPTVIPADPPKEET